MPTIKEYREFFLRNTPVNTGSKRDQETGFPIKYFVNGVQKFNRFLKSHVPSENVFKKFLESITFKLNPEDTASLTQQGLAKKASDAEAYTGTVIFTDSMARFVEPVQLPVVEADGTPGNVVVTVTPDTIVTSGRIRRRYKVKANYTPTNLNDYTLVVSTTQVGVGAASSYQPLITTPIAANILTANSLLEMDIQYNIRSFTNNGGLYATLNGQTLFSIGFIPNSTNNVYNVKCKVFYKTSTTAVVEVTGIYGSTFIYSRQVIAIVNNNFTGLNFAASQDLVVGVVTGVATTANQITVDSFVLKRNKQ